MTDRRQTPDRRAGPDRRSGQDRRCRTTVTLRGPWGTLRARGSSAVALAFLLGVILGWLVGADKLPIGTLLAALGVGGP